MFQPFATSEHSFALTSLDESMFLSAHHSAWNPNDIPWHKKPNENDALVRQEYLPISITPWWNTLTPEKRVVISRNFVHYRIAQYCYGEHLAMRHCALIAAERSHTFCDSAIITSQQYEETRHTYVFSRYLKEVFGSVRYECGAPLIIFDQLLVEEPRWEFRLAAIQMVHEALASYSFEKTNRYATDSLLRAIIAHVTEDETGHEQLGTVFLKHILTDPAIDHYKLLVFLKKATIELMRPYFPEVAYRNSGLDQKTIRWCRDEIHALSTLRVNFKKTLVANITQNLVNVGLLSNSSERSLWDKDTLLAAVPD